MAPAEGLSAPAPRARGPPSQLPAPSCGAPGQGPAGQRPGSREPCGRTGTEPPRAPGFARPWGAGAAEPPPTPAEEVPEAMFPPSLFPPPGRTSASASSPAPGAPRPLPGLAPHPPFQGVRLRVQEGPSSLPFQLHETSRSRQRSHGAPLPHLLPPRPPRVSRGGRGTPRGGDSPFSWDRKP